jgi:hypothetical protein
VRVDEWKFINVRIPRLHPFSASTCIGAQVPTERSALIAASLSRHCLRLMVIPVSYFSGAAFCRERISGRNHGFNGSPQTAIILLDPASSEDQLQENKL